MSLLGQNEIFEEMTWSTLHTTAMVLISTQGGSSLLLFALLSYELKAKPYDKEAAAGKMRPWKVKLIAFNEIFDLLLEIAIIVVFSKLQMEYDDLRERNINAAGFSESVTEAPDTTATYIFFLVFASICMIIDIYETVVCCKDLLT